MGDFSMALDLVPPQTPRALVVDDEPAIAEMITTALQAEGWEVAVACSASEVFDKIRQESYGLLVLDVMLPDMDGIMVHSRVRALDPDLARHTIFISAWARTPEVRDYLRTVGTFLPKPFSVGDLLRLARSMN